MANMRLFLLVSVLFIHHGVFAEKFSLPKSFENGEVADALDFNSNFESIRDEINDNAPWRNHDSAGVLYIDVDCSQDVNALRKAYHANMDAEHLSFSISGSCATALFFTSQVNSKGETFWAEYQPKNKIIEFRPKVEGGTYTLLPVDIDGREITSLYASFGNGFYFNGANIQMGRDDSYGVLYSRNSNGGLTRSKIIGKGSESSRSLTYGVIVQYGASAYLIDVDVSKVSSGVYTRQSGSVRTYMLNADASYRGLWLTAGGMFESRGQLSVDAPEAIVMSGGSLNASVKSVTGSITLYDASATLWFDAPGTLDSDIFVYWSRLTILTDPDNTETVNNLASLTESELSSRFSCYGLSFLDIDSLDVRNQGDKQCLDNEGWNQMIKDSDYQ